MKKIVSGLVGLAAVASVASAQTVTSANIVGYQKISKPAGALNLIGVNFAEEDVLLSDFVDVGQFQGSRYPNSADQVLVWNVGAQSYEKYGLYDDGTTIEWRLLDDFRAPGAVEPTLSTGTGVWVISAESTDSELIVSGEVVTDQYITNNIVEGLQILAFPFSTDKDLNQTALGGVATGSRYPNSADQILAWNTASQEYEKYGYYDDGTDAEWRPLTDFRASLTEPIILDMGKGFWYNAKSDLVWVEENPYFSNL